MSQDTTPPGRRIHRLNTRTPQEMADLSAERAWFAREKPSEADLLASGDYEGSITNEALMNFLLVLATLKKKRQGANLPLSEISLRSGISKAMLSRLENGKLLNPTFITLQRYARAVGATLNLVVDNPPPK